VGLVNYDPDFIRFGGKARVAISVRDLSCRQLPFSQVGKAHTAGCPAFVANFGGPAYHQQCPARGGYHFDRPACYVLHPYEFFPSKNV